VVIVGNSTGDDEVATGDDAETLDVAEEDPSGVGESDAADPANAATRFDKVRRSGAGMLMTGIALGLQDAFELPRKEPAFVIKAAGEPDGEPGPIDLQFDPDDPANTVAVIRPWLADGQQKDPPPS
jgi:hypothetical protein